MRSEKEIQDRINFLRKKEDEEINHMNDLMNDDDNDVRDFLHDLLNISITKANMIQNERLTLEWVLDENMDCN